MSWSALRSRSGRERSGGPIPARRRRARARARDVAPWRTAASWSADAASRGGYGSALARRSQRTEQGRPGLGESAADHDDLRVEQRGNIDREVAKIGDHIVDHAHGCRITGSRQPEDGAGVAHGDHRAVIVAVRAPHRSTGEGLAVARRDGSAAGPIFEPARLR